MAEHLKQAAKEMEGAPPPLRKEAGKDALPAEQRALQRLRAADAIFREVQVAFGNQSNGGGGGGGQREQQELAGLFELELDKMKNQYETVQRAQQQQAEQQKSEAERRLEELARRQQAALEEQRRRSQQAANGGGSSNQRQQQELIDETRKAARELERLSRERRDAQMQELSRQLNQTADEAAREKFNETRKNSLYQKLGGKAAVEAVVDRFYEKVIADKRINHFFEDINMKRQIRKQKEFLAYAFGAPTQWTGKDLRKAHANIPGLNDTHFNAVAEHLQSTLVEFKVDQKLIEQVMAIAEGARAHVLNKPTEVK
jgi:hemoglobin